MARVLILVPVMTEAWNKAHLVELTRCKDQSTEIEVRSLCSGSESVENAYDDAWCAVPTILEVERAEQEGFDGIVLSCFGDPGLRPAKEAVAIPVVGVAEASVHLASQLGRRFGVITAGPPGGGAYIMDIIGAYGMGHKCVAVRTLGIPILALEEDKDREVRTFLEVARQLIADGADVIIIGCTGMTAVADELAAAIPAPVVSPAPAGLKFCEDLIALGVSQSKIAFPSPPAKARVLGECVSSERSR